MGSINPPVTHQFLHCEMEYACPKDWFQLSLTDKAGIKYCETCDTDVHLCLNQDELNEATNQGLCIAYFPNPNRPLSFRLNREKAEANQRDPDFKPYVLMGLPKGFGRSPSLKAFLEDEEDET